MATKYLKKAELTSASDAIDVRQTVQSILDDIEARGDIAALEYAAKFDKYKGSVILSEEDIDRACALVPEKLKRDIDFAHENVRKFAQAQKETLKDIEIEVVPGLIAGQKSIPVAAAGCYIPGGRYSHIASAIMTVTTAKVAGCSHIAAKTRGWYSTGDHLCGARLWCGYYFGNGRSSGRCRHEFWTFWTARGKYTCWARQSVRRRSQTHFVRSRRN